jgi:MFS family permease
MLSNIQKMYIVNFLHNLTFFGAISVPFFLEWGKINYTLIFFLQSWFMLWILIFEVPTGVIADKIGRKYSLIVSGFAISIAVLIYTSSPNFLIFLVGEFIFALGVALFSGADKALIYDTLKEMNEEKEAKYFFSRYSISKILAIVLAMPAGSVIANAMITPYPTNLAFAFTLTAIPVFLGALFAFTLKEPKRRMPKERYFTLAKQGIKHFAKHRSLKILSFDMILISATTFFIYWFYQPLLGNLGVSIFYYGFVAAAFNIFAAVLLYKLKVLERLFGTKRLLFLTALVPGIFFILLGIFENLILLLVGVLIIAGFRGIRLPVFEHSMNVFIRKKDRATVLSFVSMIERLVMIILYPIIGFLADISLQYTLLFLGVLTLVFALTSKTEEHMLK